MTISIGSVSDEFRNARLGDARRTERLVDLADELADHPTLSLPQVFGLDEAGLEGAYRFLGNRSVSPEAILAPHFAHSVARASAHRVVYVAHDTTEVRHPCSGLVLYLHLSFGVGTTTPDDELVGLLGAEFNYRDPKRKSSRDTKTRKKDPNRESLRWGRSVHAVHVQIGSASSVIHVMDREADMYELLSEMHRDSLRFIIRASSNRACKGAEGERELLFPTLAKAEGEFVREVPLSKRKAPWSPKDARRHPAREMRPATLSYAAKEITVFKSISASDPSLPESLTLNYVHVWEPAPPEGETGVDWKLVTKEAVGTPAEIEAVVDGYRKRWRIEEFNKALKTGCGVEKTQLEGKASVENHIGISLVIAWRMLRLRNLERTCPEAPASDALGPLELEVLQEMMPRPMSATPTAREALWAIAALGGHLKRNGPPGWLTLTRGYTRLLDYLEGWRAAKRCDQS